MWLPVRVLLITLLLTLLSFAISLLFGITGTFIAAKLRGVVPDMRLAYRYVAFPIGAVVGVATLLGSAVTEVRHYRRNKTLAGIERAS